MPRRTVRPRPALLAPLALAAAACTDPTAAPREIGAPNLAVSGRGTTLPAGRYLVGTTGELAPSVLAAAGATVLERFAGHRFVEVTARNPTALRGAAGVRWVEPSYEFTLDAQEGTGALPALAGAASGASASPQSASAPWYVNKVQWNMRSSRADQTWTGTNRGSGVQVCIIDSGIDETHQELTNKVVARRSFVTATVNGVPVDGDVRSPAPLDSNGHGTHVAGTVTANGVVTAGFAPDAQLMTAKVFAATGGTPVGRVVNALRWCTDNGADVVNMSLGGIRYYPPVPLTLEPSYNAYAEAVKYATDAGVVVAVSAGNSNLRLPNTKQVVVPAQVPGTIIVGATGPLSRVGTWPVGGANVTAPLLAVTAAGPSWDPFDAAQVNYGPDGKAFYSNFGEGVQVFAPGGRGGVPAGYVNRIIVDAAGTRQQQTGSIYDNVFAACSRFAGYTGFVSNPQTNPANQPGGGSCRSANQPDRYASLAGTSMAAPHVAGLAALLYSELGGARTVANRQKVEGCIRSGTDNVGPSSTFGGGRINAVKAVACVRS